MSFLSDAKEMIKLRSQASAIKKELKKVHIEAEEDGVILTMDGEQNFVSVKIAPELAQGDVFRLEKAIVTAGNKAVKKARNIAAEKMKNLMGGQMPGFGN